SRPAGEARNARSSGLRPRGEAEATGILARHAVQIACDRCTIQSQADDLQATEHETSFPHPFVILPPESLNGVDCRELLRGFEWAAVSRKCVQMRLVGKLFL